LYAGITILRNVMQRIIWYGGAKLSKKDCIRKLDIFY